MEIATMQDAQDTAPENAGRRLLVIEDDPDALDLVRETLEDHFGPGTVTGAGDGASTLALDLASFDLILSDYNLPDCTGLDLLEKIRQRCDTPVIMVTGENGCHTATEAVRRGAIDYIVKAGDYIFTIPLAVEKNLAAARMRRENDRLRKELESSLKRTEEMAATDAMTGLYNRRHFNLVLGQMMSDAQRNGHDLACAMIDLDQFKQLNDTLGHQAGDEVVILAARAISDNLRRMDVAARYGGDEFVVLLPHTDATEAAAVCERVRRQFRPASAALLKRDRPVGMSMGVGTVVADAAGSAEQLVAAADAGLYAAKEAGRDCVKFCPPTRSKMVAA